MKKIITSIGLCMLIAGTAISAASKGPKAGPNAKSLVVAEEALAKAFRENNANGIQSYLSDDRAVIVAFGQVQEGKGLFPSGIRSGFRTLKTFDVSEPRACLDRDTGWVTFKLHLAGVLGGKPFDVMEGATDVWIWKDGG